MYRRSRSFNVCKTLQDAHFIDDHFAFFVCLSACMFVSWYVLTLYICLRMFLYLYVDVCLFAGFYVEVFACITFYDIVLLIVLDTRFLY